MGTTTTRKWLAAAAMVLLAGAGMSASTAAFGSDDPGAAASAKKAKPFKPTKLAGQWVGTHTNTTFGTSGPATATVTASATEFTLQLDLGGNVFACGDPPQGPPMTIVKGSGPNTWNKKGFTVDADTPALGHVAMRYRHKRRSIRGKGTAPPCLPDITYKISGFLTYKKIDLDIEIKLGGGQTAHTDLIVTKV